MNLLANRRPITVTRLLAPLKRMLTRLGAGPGHEIRLRSNYRLGDIKVRVSFDRVPIEITLGQDDKKLHLYHETRIDERGKAARTGNFVIVDPAAEAGRIAGFLRLTPRSWVSLGSGDRIQQALFNYPEAVDEEHLVIIQGPESLVFRNLGDAGSTIGRFASDVRGTREGSYRRLREIFGGPIEPLPADAALVLIEQVIGVMQHEAYRPRSDWGLPGGLVVLPGSLTPIVVADLHAQIDNLLTVLSQNAFLDALEDGSAALIILGDAVHCEEDGKLREMDGSMLMMDLIFRLKLRFPLQVFYIRGNHDSFTEDIAKDGVPQGLLWARELVARRGQAYRKAMDDFYRLLPFVVASTDFLACHAAAPKENVTRDMLVNIHRHPDLAVELVNNRQFQPSRPNGYGRGDVKRFRRTLDLQKHATFIVGHTPLDAESTMWLNINGIRNHHVLYSARLGQVGVVTRIGGVMVPLIYPVDAVMARIRQIKDAPD